MAAFYEKAKTAHPDRGGAAGMIAGLAVGVVEADDIDTGHQQPLQHGRIIGGRAERGENLGATSHGSFVRLGE
mgnify:CR=1 FL=1